MNNRKILIPALIIVAMAQLIIPVRMIRENEATVITGEEYKFRLNPPRDREQMLNSRAGRFAMNEITLSDGQKFENGEIVYVALKVGDDGFAEVASVTQTKGEKTFPGMNAKVSYVFADSIGKILVNYPFEQDFINITNSAEFATTYREAVKNMSVVYALVCIRKNNAILKDVYIDGKPLQEVAGSKSPTKSDQ